MAVSVGVDSHTTSLGVSRDGDRATTFPTTAGITRLLVHAGSPERFGGEPRGGAACRRAAGCPRTGLWLPAMRHQPVIRPIADRLRTAGKAHQVIVIAGLHQLLTLLKAIRRWSRVGSP